MLFSRRVTVTDSRPTARLSQLHEHQDGHMYRRCVRVVDLSGTSAIFSCTGMPWQVSVALAELCGCPQPQLTLRSLAQPHDLHVHRDWRAHSHGLLAEAAEVVEIKDQRTQCASRTRPSDLFNFLLVRTIMH